MPICWRDQALDLVLVCSPMTALVRRPSRRPDLPMRAVLGAQLEREVALLRRRGVPVVVFEPDPDELAVMGQNPMDAERRGPVARQVFETTRRALAEPGLAAALAPLTAAVARSRLGLSPGRCSSSPARNGSSLSTWGSLGRSSTRSPMMLCWISSVPPAMD